jgi:hypothetical protein
MRKSLFVILTVAGVFLLQTLPFLAPAADARYVAPPQPSSTTCTQLTGSLDKSRPGQDGQIFIPIYLTNTSGHLWALHRGRSRLPGDNDGQVIVLEPISLWKNRWSG